jgi:hypothetical protein
LVGESIPFRVNRFLPAENSLPFLLIGLDSLEEQDRNRVGFDQSVVAVLSRHCPMSFIMSAGQLVSGHDLGSEFRCDANQEANYTGLKQIPLR